MFLLPVPRSCVTTVHLPGIRPFCSLRIQPCPFHVAILTQGPRWRPQSQSPAGACQPGCARMCSGARAGAVPRPRFVPPPAPPHPGRRSAPSHAPPSSRPANPEVEEARRRPSGRTLADPSPGAGAGGGGRGAAAWASWPGRGGGGHGLGRVAGEVPEAGSGVLEGTHRGRGVRGPWPCGLGLPWQRATCRDGGGFAEGARERPSSPLCSSVPHYPAST